MSLIERSNIKQVLYKTLFETNTVYSDLTEDEADAGLIDEVVQGLLEHLEAKGIEIIY